MDQEKFLNTYIELLTATVTESVQKNLILQAQKKMAESELNDAKKLLSDYQIIIQQLKDENENVTKQKDTIVFDRSNDKKSQEHLETFKNELVKARTKIQEQDDIISSLREELNTKQRTIEELTTENAKLLKPVIESKVK